ncbi:MULTISPECIES: PQQ-dependent sugar dehydrogenase [unclassified Leifsonia]|uniref:PQQ-dependent sugar dehydrogenase n=1 Tax=unclassified Leifsonia TaxID=2663824 RepID=UPI0006F7ECDA|nr:MULTISPECIES: PQQ-dependent sugar dehydrogenase [unclassified Leifsonia]KQX08113.1 glucose dehydrogenase [Leifsonia sp. Root1293]KRA12394.1 glucose dehydrogenase [Leifsonia sp. Root60]
MRSQLRMLLAAILSVICVAALLTLPPADAAYAATGKPIIGVASKKCLDVQYGSMTVGAQTVIGTCNGGADQRWTRTAEGELRVFDGARCLTAGPVTTTRPRKAVIAQCSGSASQKWSYTSAKTLKHTATGLCLHVRGARTTGGTEVNLHACTTATHQKWTVPAKLPDTTPPTAPSGLTSSALTCTAVTLSWTASKDGVGVSAYDLYHDGQLVTSVAGTVRSASVKVVAGVAWGWYVNARDAAGNVSQASSTVTVTPPQCTADTVAPTVPKSVAAVASGTSVKVTWAASTDNVAVTRYDVRRDGTVVGSVGGAVLTFTDSGLAVSRAYSYTVVARDAQGNASAASAPATTTTGAACGSPICGVAQVTTDTDIPWGLTTLPDGSVLYARRDALDIVRLVPATGAKTSVGTIPGAKGTDGEGGVMGIAIASDFAADPWLYVMHSTATDNRIVRLKYSAGKLDTTSVQVLVSGILRNKYHNGGRLRFGPDGMLYASTGDAQNGDYAQRLTGTGALNGKILRLTRTGGIPSDNPFGSYVWSYGHRNPQGIAFDSRGRLWQQEFGNSVMDETNLVVKGGNYGWPLCEGTSGNGCGTAGLIAPKKTYPTADGSCSGLTIVRDVVYIACGRGARLFREVISGDALASVQQFFVGTYGRLRTVEPSSDGGLWLTTTNQGDKDSVANNSNEKILKVTLGG